MVMQLLKDRVRCPHCDEPMVLKPGKYGWFFSCPKWPACSGTQHLPGKSSQTISRRIRDLAAELDRKDAAR